MIAPEVPVAWKLYVPAGTPAPTDTVRALVMAPLGAGMTGFGLYAQVAPAGRPVQAMVTRR